MSRFLGEIRQLGYVVPDIEAAMDYWANVMGVGPWFYNPRVPIEDYHYDGEHYDVHNSVALANSGFIQVELIQTRNDAPSMYRDFQRAGHTGLQHVAYWTQRLRCGSRADGGTGLQGKDGRDGRGRRPFRVLRAGDASRHCHRTVGSRGTQGTHVRCHPRGIA